MRAVRIGGAADTECQADRFHRVLLGVRDDPLNLIFQFWIFLDKIVVFFKYNLLFRSLVEKLPYGCAETLENIHQSSDGRGGQIALYLGDKSLRKLCAVSQLFLRQTL